MKVCPHDGTDNWREERRLGKSSVWRCRECYARRMRGYRETHPHRDLYFSARARARQCNVPFTITQDDVRRLLEAGWVCVYCDSPIGSYTGGTHPLSATLDRLIPELGYTPSNIALACHRCNAAKSEHTPASLRAWADRIESVIHRLNPTERKHGQS